MAGFVSKSMRRAESNARLEAHLNDLENTGQKELADVIKWSLFYNSLTASGVELRNEDVDIDAMTADTWNRMSKQERQAWKRYWRMLGQISFNCVLCGFPTAFGQMGCVACRPEEELPNEGQANEER